VRISRSILLVVAAVAAIAGGTAGKAEAKLTCDQPSERVFLRWLDPLPYFLAPNGGFEAGPSGWTLAGGARVVSGNEPFYLNSPTDRFSLLLPAGASATSPFTCASVDGLVARAVAVASGSPLGTLQVDLVYRNDRGQLKTLALSANLAGLHFRWAPTLPIVIGASTLLNGVLNLDLSAAEVAFRFRASSGFLSSASWQIDDLYVDPWADKLGW